MFSLLSLVCAFGCSQKMPPIKETVTVNWQQGTLSFNEFLRSLAMPYDGKAKIKGSGDYNAYGTITLVNHHATPIIIRGQKPLVRFTNNYYSSQGNQLSWLHTPWWGQSQDTLVLPNDSLQFYLVFTQEAKANEGCPTTKPRMVPVDSVDYSLHYRLIPATDSVKKKDQRKSLDLVLKREKEGSYSLHPKTEYKEVATNTQGIVFNTQSQKAAFDDFVAHFPPLSLKDIHKVTRFPEENHLPDSSAIIKEIYLKQFVNRCLNAYDKGEDALQHFVKSKTILFKFQGQYIGKLPYPEAHTTALLVRLSDPAYYYTGYQHSYYVLCFFDSQTGDALGYDIVAGVRRQSHDRHYFGGRLHLQNQQLIVEQTSMYDSVPNRYHGQTYRLQTKKYQDNLYLKKTSKTLPTIAFKGKAKEIKGVTYGKYCNAEMGYCVDLPSKIFVYNTSKTYEYISSSDDFISKDQSSSLSVTHEQWAVDRYGKTHPRSLVDYFNDEKKQYKSYNHLTHRRYTMGKGFCAFEYIIQNQVCIYEQHMVSAHGITTLKLAYPIQQKRRYAPIIKQLKQSFRLKE